MNKLALLLSIALTGNLANAADFTFSGNIGFHNDVVQTNFTIASDSTDVRVWTDSFQNGTNFDPITAVWRQTGSDWVKVGENDDNAGIAAGQTVYDSGLIFSTLTSGNYLFTVATFNNFSNGTLLSQGFNFDNQAPIAIADWAQPANSSNLRGTFYRVNLANVDTALNLPGTVVPEPETYAMFLAGLGFMGVAGRRRKGQQI